MSRRLERLGSRLLCSKMDDHGFWGSFVGSFQVDRMLVWFGERLANYQAVGEPRSLMISISRSDQLSEFLNSFLPRIISTMTHPAAQISILPSQPPPQPNISSGALSSPLPTNKCLFLSLSLLTILAQLKSPKTMLLPLRKKFWDFMLQWQMPQLWIQFRLRKIWQAQIFTLDKLMAPSMQMRRLRSPCGQQSIKISTESPSGCHTRQASKTATTKGWPDRTPSISNSVAPLLPTNFFLTTQPSQSQGLTFHTVQRSLRLICYTFLPYSWVYCCSRVPVVFVLSKERRVFAVLEWLSFQWVECRDWFRFTRSCFFVISLDDEGNWGYDYDPFFQHQYYYSDYE